MNKSYQVIGLRAVCVDFDDGRSVSFPPGQNFSINLTSQVSRLLRLNEIREMGPTERVETEFVGLSAATQSKLRAKEVRNSSLATKATSPMDQKRGEVLKIQNLDKTN